MRDIFHDGGHAPRGGGAWAGGGRSCRRAVLGAMLALAALWLAGCATVRQQVPKPVSQAWPRPDDSALARAYAPQLVAQPGQSGLYPVVSGMEALGLRAGLADGARHTLDLQYYIVRGDTTTQLLMERVLAAARRGVRVRLLVDDLDALGKDLDLATLAAVPGIEVRVFNPFATRGRFGLGQILEFLGSPQRLNRRMHNKLWIADNALAVIGGRNLGDEYFDARHDANFADLDMLVAGPVVPEFSRSFDAYWNSEWAVPIHAFLRDPPTAQALAQLDQGLRERVAGFQATAYARALREGSHVHALRTGQLALTVAPAQVFYDQPSKVSGSQPRAAREQVFADHIQPVIAAAQRELILISPYFIPGKAGVAQLRSIVHRGVRVRILTNSLASADAVPLAHAGYTRHRERLLAAGVELYEMRPEFPEAARRAGGYRWSGAYLHTKAIIADRRRVVVGSMNLDPRSRLANTEIGLTVDSEPLAQTLGRLFDEAVSPPRAFRLSLVDPALPESQLRLRWSTERDGEPVDYLREPQVGVWRRALSNLLRLIAPEALL